MQEIATREWGMALDHQHERWGRDGGGTARGQRTDLGVVRYKERSALPALEAHCIRLLRVKTVADLEPNAATATYQISDLAETAYGTGTHFVVDGTFTPDVDGVLELMASYDYLGKAEDGLGNDMTRCLFVEQNSSFHFGVVAQNGDGTTWTPQTHSDFFAVVAGIEVTYGLLISNASGIEDMNIRNARMKAAHIKR